MSKRVSSRSRRRRWQLLLLAPLLVGFIDPTAAPAPERIERRPALAPLAIGDRDRDGLDDEEERELARAFAPIVILEGRDRHRPASLSWLVAAGARAVTAFEVPESARAGSREACDWIAYAHVFPRGDAGINVQYWFYYPYNDGPLVFDHDSDWEHVTIRLDEQRRPLGADLAHHANDRPGRFVDWSRLKKRGTQPIVYSALGTHATYASASDVAWFDRISSCDDLASCADPIWDTARGDLPNLGERDRPLLSGEVLAFSGRWGRTGLLPGTKAPFGPLHHRGFCTHGTMGCPNVR